MKIAWIGTGVMGRSMAARLMDAGHSLTVYSRTKSKAEELLGRGAMWADSPAQAAGGVEAVCAMVGYPADVEEIILGPRGALQNMAPGSLCIDFTTSSPALAVKIFSAAKNKGVFALDAPVSGGDIGAREGRLSIMVGGGEKAFEMARPIFKCVGKTFLRQGECGAGQHAKMVNQIMIAGTMMGMCEGLLYARKSGLDPEKVLASVGGGAAASWSLANLYPRILKGDFEPGFFVEHFVKDLGIALESAAQMKLKLPALALAVKLYGQLAQNGGNKFGTQALIKELERMNTRRSQKSGVSSQHSE